MNIKPKTDFPDIRKVFVVHSTHGTIMGVPRENKLVRLYISMDSGNRSLALDGKELNADNILKAAQTILAPYTLEAASIPWWSAYCVGHATTASSWLGMQYIRTHRKPVRV
jgi:phenol 2-monooxygenase